MDIGKDARNVKLLKGEPANGLKPYAHTGALFGRDSRHPQMQRAAKLKCESSYAFLFKANHK